VAGALVNWRRGAGVLVSWRRERAGALANRRTGVLVNRRRGAGVLVNRRRGFWLTRKRKDRGSEFDQNTESQGLWAKQKAERALGEWMGGQV
jgi:hypothetical protein